MTGHYSLRVTFTHGAREIIARGDNPVVVRAEHSRVARNPRVIETIELCDGTETLETIWRNTWE